jgi:hypothetical protein
VLRFDADEDECSPELRRQPATGGCAVMFRPWMFAGFSASFRFVCVSARDLTM